MFDVALFGFYNNDNWGGQITCLATYMTVTDLGFSAKFLRLKNHNEKIPFICYKFCKFTIGCVNKPTPLLVWNKDFYNFVLCSDWMLCKDWCFPLTSRLFQWVEERNNKITFASSFGPIGGKYKQEDHANLAKALNRFQYLSIREKEGVDLCHKIGVKHAVLMPDPVFSQNKDFWIKIAETANITPPKEKYVAIYLLDMPQEDVEKAVKISQELNLLPFFIIAAKDKKTLDQVQQYQYFAGNAEDSNSWVAYLYHADYVITNSFHAICLTLILGKNFLVLPRKLDSSRLVNILEEFNLQDKFIRQDNDMAKAITILPDHEQIQQKIAKFYQETRTFLQKAVEDGKKRALRIDHLAKEECTGCLACQSACPKHCIVPTEDTLTGFVYPTVQEQNCVHCGLCFQACPILNKQNIEKQNNVVFCGHSLNPEIRYFSTSGGFFSELAYKVLWENNAIVFGAAYQTPFFVKHLGITQIGDLSKIRQSKYVQSDMQGIYEQIATSLKSGQSALFCGTPCQCAAVKNFLTLQKIEMTKLYLVDFICHSVNSPKAYQAYLNEIQQQHQDQIKSVWFKNKETTWEKFSTRIDFEQNTQYYIKNRYDDVFYQGFLNFYLYSRPSCLHCHFKGIDRISDITLADAWGVKVACDSKHGVSTAILHSQKGKDLFESIKQHIYFEEKTFEEISKANPFLLRSIPSGKYSDYFYRKLNEKIPFSQIINDIKKNTIIAKHTFSIPEGVSVNGAVIRAHPTAQIILKPGAKLSLNHDKYPGSHAECLLDLHEGAQLIVEGDFQIYHSCRIVVHKNAVLTLGKGYLNTDCKIICYKSITIGDALLAADCYIVDSDYHTIKQDGKVINPPAPVKFEGHVWLGQNVTVLKGVTIGYGSVIGAKSLVNKNIPAHSLAVGNPAKVLKSNIEWS